MRPIYRFGPFELNTRTGELRKDGVALKVEPKPLGVLTELLDCAGELVTKAELMESVWAGRVVTESVITRCIMKLRDALEDDAQTMIASVHGYGYRFTGEVSVLTDAGSAPESPLNRVPLAGDCPPLRPNWRLVHPLDKRASVWLAEHAKTGDKRVLKFASTMEQVRALRHEITLHRLLRRGLGERSDIALVLDYNLETQPYFLETEYCPLGNLARWSELQGGMHSVPLQTRIEIVAQLADSLALAHGLGILHFDIKPSNVLMTTDCNGQPHPRWSDFGSGRLLQPETLVNLGITQVESKDASPPVGSTLQGTFNYMAPELLRGDPPTLQSDVYAMGVMLYQIIAADLTKPLTAGWEQDIDDELLREDIAAAAAGNPRHRMASAMELSRRLRSLEARRAGLAAMRARQQRLSALASRLERARARRPWLVAALISFAAGLTASLWFYRAAVASRDEALKQAAVAQGVSEFISQDVLGATSRYDFISPKDVTVIDALNRGVAQLDARSGTMPALIEASNRYVIAGAYSQMAQDEAAAAQVRKAIKLFDSTLGAADIRTLRARYFLAASLIFAGKFPDADAVLQELATGGAPIDAWPELRLLDHVTRGGLAYYREDYARAATFYEQALAEDEQLHATDMEGRATRRQMLASSYVHLSRFAEADRLLEASLTELSRAAKLRSAAMAETQEAYGVSLYYQRRLAEAETLLNSAYSVLAEKLGPDASCSSEALEYLGLIYLATNRIDDSVRVLRAAYGDIVKRAGEANIFSLSARGHLGMAEFAAGQRERGLDTLRQVAAALRSVLGPAAPKTEYFRYQFFRDSRVANPAGGLAAALNAPFDARLLALESPDEDWTSKLRDIDGPMRQKDSLALAAK